MIKLTPSIPLIPKNMEYLIPPKIWVYIKQNNCNGR
jgi:hypothetical protein